MHMGVDQTWQQGRLWELSHVEFGRHRGLARLDTSDATLVDQHHRPFGEQPLAVEHLTCPDR
jgi:hypothetical protein